jgi:hypothetical protein
MSNDRDEIQGAIKTSGSKVPRASQNLAQNSPPVGVDLLLRDAFDAARRPLSGDQLYELIDREQERRRLIGHPLSTVYLAWETGTGDDREVLLVAVAGRRPSKTGDSWEHSDLRAWVEPVAPRPGESFDARLARAEREADDQTRGDQAETAVAVAERDAGQRAEEDAAHRRWRARLDRIVVAQAIIGRGPWGNRPTDRYSRRGILRRPRPQASRAASGREIPAGLDELAPPILGEQLDYEGRQFVDATFGEYRREHELWDIHPRQVDIAYYRALVAERRWRPAAGDPDGPVWIPWPVATDVDPGSRHLKRPVYSMRATLLRAERSDRAGDPARRWQRWAIEHDREIRPDIDDVDEVVAALLVEAEQRNAIDVDGVTDERARRQVIADELRRTIDVDPFA